MPVEINYYDIDMMKNPCSPKRTLAPRGRPEPATNYQQPATDQQFRYRFGSGSLMDTCWFGYRLPQNFRLLVNQQVAGSNSGSDCWFWNQYNFNHYYLDFQYFYSKISSLSYALVWSYFDNVVVTPFRLSLAFTLNKRPIEIFYHTQRFQRYRANFLLKVKWIDLTVSK